MSKTLAEVARECARKGERRDVRIVSGGLGNGRSERSLTVGRALVNGGIVVTQGTTADQVFVRWAAAEAILVEDAR